MGLVIEVAFGDLLQLAEGLVPVLGIVQMSAISRPLTLRLPSPMARHRSRELRLPPRR